MLSKTACPDISGKSRFAGKRIIFTIVFVLGTSALDAQYKMSIKKADNTTEDIWVHDIVNLTFTNIPFTCVTNTITYAGKTYNTVLIGSQCWLKENLNVGTGIDGSSDQNNNSTIEKYCYSNDPNNCTTYGGLYQWAEAVQYQNGATNTTNASPALTGNVQGICPTGWHIPTQAEYAELSSTVSDNAAALKAVGQGDGTNTSGFSALFAGNHDNANGFLHLGTSSDFWTSTEFSLIEAYRLTTNSSSNSISLGGWNKNAGLSVRCLKD